MTAFAQKTFLWKVLGSVESCFPACRRAAVLPLAFHYAGAVDAWALYDNSGDLPRLLDWRDNA